jgi:hypothetical protein
MPESLEHDIIGEEGYHKKIRMEGSFSFKEDFLREVK